MEETKMNKTIMAILMVALMIVPMAALVQAQGQGPSGPGIVSTTNGTLNVSLDRDSLKQQIKDCLQDTNSDCSQVQEMGRAFASGVINKFCGNAEQKMEQMRARVENAQGLTDEEKELFMETIRNQNEKLTRACGDFEKSAKDKGAIEKSTKELKTMAKETTAKITLAREKIQERRVGLVLERSGQLEAKLERFQARLQNNSNCSGEMEQLRNQFREQIQEANGFYGESKQIRERLMNGTGGSGNFSGDIQEAQGKMQQAQNKLQEAQKTLKQIIVQLRQCAVNVSEDEPEENETEIEENETEE